MSERPDPLPDELLRPHPDRLAPDHPLFEAVLTAHRDALARDDDGYLDPATGHWVFTAAFLHERGFCCEQGCRHCPWIDRP